MNGQDEQGIPGLSYSGLAKDPLIGISLALQGLGAGLQGQPSPVLPFVQGIGQERHQAMQAQQFQQTLGLHKQQLHLDAFSKLLPIAKDLAASGADPATLKSVLGVIGQFGSGAGLMPALDDKVIQSWVDDREALKGLLSGEIEQITQDPAEQRKLLTAAAKDKAMYKDLRQQALTKKGIAQAQADIQAGADPTDAFEKAAQSFPEVGEQIKKLGPDIGKYMRTNMQPTGQTAITDLRRGTQTIVGQPLKTAQPWTPTYVASVAAGAIQDPQLSQEKAKAIQSELATQAGNVALQRGVGSAQAQVTDVGQQAARLKSFNTQLGGAQAALTDTGQRAQFAKAYQGKIAQLDAELSQTPAGEPRATAVAGARTAGQAAPAEVTQQVALLKVAQKTITKLDEFNQDEINRWVMRVSVAGAGKMQAAITELASGMSPQEKDRFFRFLALNEQMRGTAFSEGGKQLTPFEASVVFGYTPDGREFSGRLWTVKKNELQDRINLRLESIGEATRTRRGQMGLTPGTGPERPATGPQGGAYKNLSNEELLKRLGR